MPNNQKEDDLRKQWLASKNWSGPDWIALYFNKQDPRLWVAKRKPWMGFTINLAHPSAAFWLILLLAGIPTAISLGLALLVLLLH